MRLINTLILICQHAKCDISYDTSFHILAFFKEFSYIMIVWSLKYCVFIILSQIVTDLYTQYNIRGKHVIHFMDLRIVFEIICLFFSMKGSQRIYRNISIFIWCWKMYNFKCINMNLKIEVEKNMTLIGTKTIFGLYNFPPVFLWHLDLSDNRYRV